jgi:hypothetical protein
MYITRLASNKIFSAYRVHVGKPDRKNHSEDLSIDGVIILKLIFKEIG